MAPPRCRGLFLRSDFSSSPLVRLLGTWSPVDGPAPGMDVAERLGLWLGAFDAIKLQAVNQGLRRPLPAQARPRARADDSPMQMRAQFDRVRAALRHAIGQDPVALAGADPADPGPAPFQRRHADLQRHMEQMLRPLREQLRRSLSQTSPALGQLASLDAALEELLSAREQQLLAGLPALLTERYEHLRRAHGAAPPATDAALDPGLVLPPPALDWLAVFMADWQQALQAELELRLEPVAGLLAALHPDLFSTP